MPDPTLEIFNCAALFFAELNHSPDGPLDANRSPVRSDARQRIRYHSIASALNIAKPIYLSRTNASTYDYRKLLTDAGQFALFQALAEDLPNEVQNFSRQDELTNFIRSWDRHFSGDSAKAHKLFARAKKHWLNLSPSERRA